MLCIALLSAMLTCACGGDGGSRPRSDSAESDAPRTTEIRIPGGKPIPVPTSLQDRDLSVFQNLADNREDARLVALSKALIEEFSTADVNHLHSVDITEASLAELLRDEVVVRAIRLAARPGKSASLRDLFLSTARAEDVGWVDAPTAKQLLALGASVLLALVAGEVACLACGPAACVPCGALALVLASAEIVFAEERKPGYVRVPFTNMVSQPGNSAGGSDPSMEPGAETSMNYCASQCPENPFDEELLPRCCTPEGKCGYRTDNVHIIASGVEGPGECVEGSQPGSLDDSCSAWWDYYDLERDHGYSSAADDTVMPGCCLADGVCGVLTSATRNGGATYDFGFGCLPSGIPKTPRSRQPDGGVSDVPLCGTWPPATDGGTP